MSSRTLRVSRAPASTPTSKRSVGTAVCARRPAPWTANSSCGIEIAVPAIVASGRRDVRHPRVDRLAALRVDPCRALRRRGPVRLVAGHLLVVALAVALRDAGRVGGDVGRRSFTHGPSLL